MELGSTVLLILFMGSLASVISNRFGFANTRLLVISGLVISIAYHAFGLGREPTGELILSVVLPPLIFQAALTVNYAVFRKVQVAVILLAVVGVAISAIICSIILAAFTGLSLITALAFGVIISPTDAVWSSRL